MIKFSCKNCGQKLNVEDTQPTEPIVQEPPKKDISPKESAGSWAAESYAAQKLDLKLQLKPKQKYNLRIITANVDRECYYR